jgi:hypothetical protein
MSGGMLANLGQRDRFIRLSFYMYDSRTKVTWLTTDVKGQDGLTVAGIAERLGTARPIV